MIISIANHKGGTGKTTTTHNLGYALAEQGHRVLLVDLDPQGNLSYSMGIREVHENMYSFLHHGGDLSAITHRCGNLDVLPSDYYHFYPFEYKQTRILKSQEALLTYATRYNYVLVDTPPVISDILHFALEISDKILIPIQPDALSLEGVHQLNAFIHKKKKSLNRLPEIMGVLGINVIEKRKLSEEVLKYINNVFGIHVFNNYIRSCVRTAEAPSHGISVLEYAPNSTSSVDYKSFSKEFHSMLNNTPHHVI